MDKEDTVTFVVVLSPDSTLTPRELICKIVTLALPVTVKETCYGMLIEGKKEDAEKVVKEIRKLDPNKVFAKVRGFPVGDSRICRAKRGGGSRLGFHQLEGESKLLPLISHGLEKLPSCKEGKTFVGEKEERYPIDKLKRLIEAISHS